MTTTARTRTSISLLLAIVTAAGAARAQGPAPASPGPAPQAAADSAPSPTGSFVRSLVVPGWGQAAHGAYLRGGVYFATQTASWFMLFKTAMKLGEAHQVDRRVTGVVRDSILEHALTQPDEMAPDADGLAALVAAHPLVADARALIDAREQQREDWIAWTIFWTLASAVDALVTAHLSDFPVDVVTQPRGGGSMRIGVRVPTGGRP